MAHIPVIETDRLKLILMDMENIDQEDHRQFEQKLSQQLTNAILGDKVDRETKKAMRVSLENVIRSKIQDKWYEEWQSVLIILKNGNKVIGGICFEKNPEEYSAAQINFMIQPEHRNNGYMTEALRAGIPWLFQNPDIAYLLAETEKSNMQSCKVLEKAGMVVYKETAHSLLWEIEY
jgi:RimJ/RimL family protein N-acetyltransferase